MKKPIDSKYKILMDRERLNRYNDRGCAACGRKFTLGEIAVMACGAWQGGLRPIHEYEAVFDPRTGGFVEQRCYEASR